MPACQPQFVDRVQVGGVCDGDPKRLAVERVRNRDDPLEHVQRHQLGGLPVDARQREVDERHVVTRREHPRDPLAGGVALVDDRLGDRAPAGAPADDVQLVF